MQTSLGQIIWIWLICDVVITLTVVGWHYLAAYVFKKADPVVFHEDCVNLKLGLVNGTREVLEKIVGFSLLAYFAQITPSIWGGKLDWSWWNLLLCFVVADFLYYIGHLAGHKVQLLWNQHCVHHSSERFALSTGFRLSWLDFLSHWLFYWPLAWLGFPAEMILICVTVISCYTHIMHTTHISHVPYLEYIFNTPKAHRIHHSAYVTHLDKNMAGVFVIWDRLFGTFTLQDADKVVFGLTKPLETKNILYVNFSEWIRIKNILKKLGWRRSAIFLLNSPEKNKDITA